MIVKCFNGFYEFFPTRTGEVEIFEKIYFPLVQEGNVFVPSCVAAISDVNFQGESVGSGTALVSTWNKRDCFELNRLTVDLKTNSVVPIDAIVAQINYGFDNFSYATRNIAQAGGAFKGGRLNNFIGTFDFNNFVFEVR